MKWSSLPLCAGLHGRTKIAARDVHEDVDGKLTVLSADRRRTPCTLDSGDLAQGDSATTRKRDLNLLRDGIGILSWDQPACDLDGSLGRDDRLGADALIAASDAVELERRS